jgi:hypothetical protein
LAGAFGSKEKFRPSGVSPDGTKTRNEKLAAPNAVPMYKVPKKINRKAPKKRVIGFWVTVKKKVIRF